GRWCAGGDEGWVASEEVVGKERTAVVKATVLRAVKAGRISGTKDEQGERHVKPPSCTGSHRPDQLGGRCPRSGAVPRRRFQFLGSPEPELLLVRAGDGPQQRLEPIHVLADMRIEVAQADAARRYARRANLFLELGIRADGNDGVMQGLQDRCGRFGRGQEAVPRRVLVIDMR